MDRAIAEPATHDLVEVRGAGGQDPAVAVVDVSFLKQAVLSELLCDVGNPIAK